MQLQREQSVRTTKHITLDEIGRRIALGEFQELNIIVKGDVDGSIEALSDSLEKLATDEIKVNILGVSQLLIDQKTEVSIEVVSQMAEEVRKSFSADFSVATSGYAGPTGGTINNPIGTVFIAVSSYRSTEVERFVFSGDRQSIVNQATESALRLLYSAVKKQQ